MSKFEVGDRAIVIKNTSGHMFDIGLEVEIVHETGLHNGETEYECKHWGKYWYLTDSELKKKSSSEYLSSNRFKLLQAIKETGYSSRRLSDIAVGNESYFYNYTGKARFDKKGDISDSMLEQLKGSVKSAQSQLTSKLTDALIHEREELAIAPKTVDENNVPVVERSIDECVAEGKVALDTFSDNTQKTIELQKKFFESAQNRIQTKKDNKAKKFLIVFVLLVIILAVYFFAR